MASTTRARPTSVGPLGTASRSPVSAATATTAPASPRETTPAGIGLSGFRPASAGASTRSFRAPIANWSAVIERASRSATSGSAPARRAIAPTTRPSRIEGNGWTRRARPAARAPGRTGVAPRSAIRRASDVDELVEVLHQVVDQPLATVTGRRPDPRDEMGEGDRRDDDVATRIPSDRRGSPTTRSERLFETTVVDARRVLEALDDANDAAALHDVTEELRDPGVDLLVGLLREP